MEEWYSKCGANCARLVEKGWLMEMSFGDEAGGVSALKVLQSYVARLDQEYGNRGFRYFSKGDMRVLGQALN